MTTKTTTSGASLQTRPFSSAPTMIPQLGADGRWNGKIVKIELVLLRSPEGGARQHLWLIPDPRPHNHPWRWIDCKVLRGRYKAVEYRRKVEQPAWSGSDVVESLVEPTLWVESEVILSAGEPEHRLWHGEHHQVIEVEPGTISIMTFGPIVGDGKQWGHLVSDGENKHFELAQPMSGFVDALWHCNPHLAAAAAPGLAAAGKPPWSDPYAEHSIPNLADLMKSVGL